MDTDAVTAEAHVTALYQAHALSLKRLAILMLNDGAAAEDVVQDAFLGLYRRWDTLTDATGALPYVRASVINGCRTAMKRRARRLPVTHDDRPLESAEAAVLYTEEQRSVAAAIRRLPARQREVLILRYYLEMTEADAAHAMRISRGTVKSATSRAIAAISRALREEP